MGMMQFIKNLSASRLSLLAVTGIFLFFLPIPHTVALRLFTLAVAAILSLQLIRKHSMPSLPLKLPFALWIAAALASLVFAVNPGYSLGEIKSEILYGLLVYFVFFSQARNEMEWKWWISIMITSLIVMALTATVLWYEGNGVISPKYIYNGVGPFLTLLITLLPFIVLLLLNAGIKSFPVNLLWPILALLLALAYLTHNRMFWVAAVVSTGALLVLLSLKERDRRRKKQLFLSIVFLLILGAGLFYQALVNRIAQDQDASSSTIASRTLKQDPRPMLWAFAIEQIRHHPWTGIGFGARSFEQAYPEWKQRDATLFHAHNIFLSAGIQMGIPGIFVLMFLFFSIIKEYWRFYRSADATLQWLGACGLAMVIGVLLKNMTDYFFSRDLALLFWALVGMTFGYGKRLQRGMQSR